MNKALWKDIMDAEFARMKVLADELRTLTKSTDDDVRNKAMTLQTEWNRAAARHSEAFTRYFELSED